jgi:hypothetical protein
MFHNVFRVSYTGMPRDHYVIFVETHNDLSGHVYQVTGDIQNGMSFESATFQSKTLIGKVTAAKLSRINDICQGIPPPKKQFQGPHRLYPEKPIRRCQK